jgi:hypothetical protein
MKPKLLALLLALTLFALSGLLLTGCAFTYPGEHGNITLEFQPTDAMLQAAGLNLHPVLRDK